MTAWLQKPHRALIIELSLNKALSGRESEVPVLSWQDWVASLEMMGSGNISVMRVY
jgi:hypothetical protein